MSDTPPVQAAAPTAYRGYVLAVLTAIFTLNFVDRGLVILLLEPMKLELRLTDSQIGFVTGSTFGLFYAVLSVPLARWSDRGDRTTIAGVSILLWGVTVSSLLFVTNYAQLIVARIGAAIGEAGCHPPTYSLVGDYYPGAAERPRAMSIYWLANPLSALIGFIVGGWLSTHFGWRVAFVAMGVPALILGLLVKLTVRDPRTIAPPRDRSRDKSLRQAFPQLWRLSSTRHLSIGLVVFYATMFALAPWYGAFLMRSHGMTTAELGFWLGIIFGVAGIAGVLGGGFVAGRLLVGDEARQMQVTAILVLLLVPGYGVFLLAGKMIALATLVLLAIGINFVLAPAFALLQRLVDDQMRATALSLIMLVSNVAGMALGVQLVGLLSDALAPRYGSQSLRYALLAVSIGSLWSAWHFWCAGRSVRADLLNLAGSTTAPAGILMD